MRASLLRLFRYRALIASLVVRELKARYRGSVLGLLWSFVNPLLLLLVFTFIFTRVLPDARPRDLDPYALFLFCGILPWTWFSASLQESSIVLVSGANLIRRVLFPAEVLPIVTVLAGLVHFGLGLVILALFFVFYGVPFVSADLVWFPVIVGIQLLFTIGLALLLSALTVHFRDIRDLVANLLTLWFWATPIVYSFSQVPAGVRPLLEFNPLTHLVVAYQQVLFVPGPFSAWPQVPWLAALSLAAGAAGYFVFDRLRDTLPEDV